jgi:hypothetical protein
MSEQINERAKHTPGPWENKGEDDECGFFIITAAGLLIAEVNSIGPSQDDPDGFPGCGGDPGANARLVAAAPDLLAALKRVLADCPYVYDADSCECGENGTGFDDAGKPCCHIRAARVIAQVEGR